MRAGNSMPEVAEREKSSCRLLTVGCQLVLVGAVLPDGLALFEETGETFLEVGGAAHAGVFEDGALEIGVEAGGGRGNEQSLGAGDAAGAGGDDHFGEFVYTGH